MNHAPAVTTVSPDYRTDILRYATALLPPADAGEPGLVMSWAAPLLDWAGQADGKRDLECRMRAMSRAHCNDQDRLSALARTAPVRAAGRLTPDSFLDHARAYYRFITDVA